jgi:hypothetical protein
MESATDFRAAHSGGSTCLIVRVRRRVHPEIAKIAASNAKNRRRLYVAIADRQSASRP